MKRTCKPNFVAAFSAAGDHSFSPDVAIGVKRSTRKCRPDGSGLSAGRRSALPYLILHHEEFAWPRMLPPAPVSSYLTVSPITSTSRGWSVFCCTCRHAGPKARAPGRYPARCPLVFGLSSAAQSSSGHPVRLITRRRPV